MLEPEDSSTSRPIRIMPVFPVITSDSETNHVYSNTWTNDRATSSTWVDIHNGNPVIVAVSSWVYHGISVHIKRSLNTPLVTDHLPITFDIHPESTYYEVA